MPLILIISGSDNSHRGKCCSLGILVREIGEGENVVLEALKLT